MDDEQLPSDGPVRPRVRRPIAAGMMRAGAEGPSVAVVERPTAEGPGPAKDEPSTRPPPDPLGRRASVRRPIARGTLKTQPPEPAPAPAPGAARILRAPWADPPAAPRLQADAEAQAPASTLLSENVCRYLSVLPLAVRGTVVVVAIADPSDTLARTIVEASITRTGRRQVEFVTVPHAHLGPVIDRTFGREPMSAPIAEPTLRVAPLPFTPEEAPVPAPAPRVTPPVPVPVPVPERLRGPLGELLVAEGLITAAELDEALALQSVSGGRLGEILSHGAVVREEDVARLLAAQRGLALVDLDTVTVDPLVARLLPQRLALTHRVIALDETGDVTRVAVADPFDEDVLAQVREHLGTRLELVLATDTQIDLALQRVYATEHIDAACERLLKNMPENSAAVVFSPAQKRFAAVVAILGLIGFVLAPIGTFVLINLLACAFYTAFSGYKFWLAYESLDHDNQAHITADAIAALDDHELPTFTILMPMYREAAVVPKLVKSISALDYPRTKLDIKLLLEEDDDETLAAVRALDLPPHFRVVIVPDALPKTKPKACNYGLLLARGDITVIYDAEDEPDPDQLKKVVLTFRDADPATVCVQCKLNYYNRTQNLLTRWFTTEYSMWFDVFLPGLDAHDSPIPLGGTSNHFVTEELLGLGAWDPHNVAEDADLGIRLNKAGWRTAVLDSTTYEEANPDLHNWIRQRSRWVKGYMQTWLVHMRHPVQLWRAIGTRSFLSFQMTVGGTFFGFLLNPFYWALTSLWLLTEAGVIRQLFPGVIYYAAAVGLFVGNFTFTYFNAVGSMRRGHFDLIKFALLSPVYWSFMSIAAWKGAYQLIVNPHYWEKTIHGLAPDTLRDEQPD